MFLDIEDETRSWSRDSDKEHRQLQPDICEHELQHFRILDNHNVMSHPSKQMQPKLQTSNKGNIIPTNRDTKNIKSKSKRYNETGNDENESDIQAKDFAVGAKKVICVGQNPDVVTSILAKDLSTEQREKTTHNLSRMNDALVGRSSTTSPKLLLSKDENSKSMENDFSIETSLEQNVKFPNRDCDNYISDVCNVTKHPNKEDIELSPETQFKSLENKTIPKKKDLEKENTLIIQNLTQDPKSDKCNSKSKILSAENEKQSNDNVAQFPTALLGTIDQQTISDKTRGFCRGKKRQDSSERIDQINKDVTTRRCQEKSNIESINSSNDVRTSTTQIPTKVMLANASYNREIVKLNAEVVIGPSEVVNNKLNMSLKESTPYSLRNGNDILVEHQQLPNSTKVWSSSKQVVPGKAMSMININTGTYIKAGIKSEIMSDPVVSKLYKDFRSPKVTRSNQLVSNSKEEITCLDSNIDGKAKSKSEIALSDYEHLDLDHKPIVKEIIHHSDWKSAQSNFDNSGIELKSQEVEIAEHDLGAVRNEKEMQSRESTQKEIMQNVLEHGEKCKRNLKPKFELGRNNVGVEKNTLVFRHDTGKMKQPLDSHSSALTLRNQEGLITERIIAADGVTTSDLHKDVKEMLSDDLEQNVKSRKAGEHSCKVYNEVINDNDQTTIKMFEQTVVDEQNKTCHKQIERDKAYYEIGNFDKIIEDMLDGGFRNVENRGSYPNVEKYTQSSRLFESEDEEYSMKQEEAETEVNSKEKTSNKDVLRAYLFDECSKDGASTQIVQHQTGWESVFKLESALKPTLGEKSKVRQDKEVSCQDENMNVEKNLTHVQNHVECHKNLIANLSNIAMDGKCKDDLKENRTNSVKHVNQNSRGEELNDSKHEMFEMQKQQNKGPLRDLQCQEPKDVLDKEDFTQHENEYLPPKAELPHSCTTLQSSSLPSIAKSNLRESTSQDDSTMALLEKNTSNRKSPNLVIPDMNTTNSECLSSPEPSLQDGFISGKIDFEKTIERYILPGTKNSYSTRGCENKSLPNSSSSFERTSPFHENLEIITRTLESNTFPEDKSGSISEADFDTSFSDHLSYVEEDVVEVKKATAEKIDETENKKYVKNTGVCNNPIFRENVSKNETPFEPEANAKLYLDPSVSSKELSLEYANVKRSRKHEGNPGKYDSENLLNMEKFSQHPEYFETNPGEDSDIVTDGMKYMSYLQSFHETRSHQENFQGVIFRNLDAVPMAPSKETSFAQNLCDVRNSGQGLGHFESCDKLFNSNQKMSGGTSKSDYDGYDKLANNVKEVTPGFNEVASECDKINTGDNDAMASYNRVTTSKNRGFPNHNEVTTAYIDNMQSEQKMTADNFSENGVGLPAEKNDDKGNQKSSLAGDVDLHQEILSRESTDVLSTEFEFDRQTEKDIIKSNGNTFQCQQVSSSDNLKLQLNPNMDEEELDRHSLAESSGPEINDVRQKDVSLKDGFAPQSKDSFSGEGDYPNKKEKVGRKTFKRNIPQNKVKNVEDSSESSSQEGTIHRKRRGEVNFQKNIERSVLGRSSSSCSRHNYTPLRNHSSQRNVSPYEDKSGYVAEVELDTSISDNLSNVEDDLVGTKTKDIEKTENKHCMKNTGALVCTVFEGNVSSDVSAHFDHETEFCPIPGVSNKKLSFEFEVHHDKHDSCSDIQDKVATQLTQSNNTGYLDSLGKCQSQSLHDAFGKRSQHKAQMHTGTNPTDELNITIDGTKETDRVQSLETGKSTSQETLEETGSQQSCFKKDVFDAATTKTHNNKDWEQSFDQLMNSKQKRHTSESDCGEFQNRITPSYNILSDNNEDATPGTTELAPQFGEITEDYTDEAQRNYCNVIPGDNDVSPKFFQVKSESHFSLSHNEVTSSLEEIPPQHNEMTAHDPAKESARCARKKNDDISANENASHEEMHMPYVQEDLIEVKRDRTDELEGMGKKHCVINNRAFDPTMVNEFISSDEKQFKHAVNTNQTQSLVNVQSTLQETEMRGIRSEQKSFKEIIFGNVDVVSVTPSKEKFSCDIKTSEVKDIIFAHEKNLGQNIDDIESFNKSANLKTSSDPMMISGTLEADCNKPFLSRSEVTPSHNMLPSSYKDVTPGTNEPKSQSKIVKPRYKNIPPRNDDVISSINEITTSYKRLVPDKDGLSVGNILKDSSLQVTHAKDKDDVTVVENNSNAKINIGGRQDISMEYDRENYSSEDEDIISVKEYKLRRHVTKEKIAGSEVNNFRCQNVSLNDDLKLQLHSSKEQKLNDQAMLKSSTTENEMKSTRGQNVTPKSYPLSRTVVSYSGREDIYPKDEKLIEEKLLFERNIWNYDHEMKSNGRQMIALGDDFVLNGDESVSVSKNTQSNKAMEISEQVFIESSMSENEIKNAERQQIALEDDFQLPSENSICERRYNHSDGENENISLKEEFPNTSFNEFKKKENYLKQEKKFSRKTFNDCEDDAPNSSRFEDDVNHPSASKDGGLNKQKEGTRIEHMNEHMIYDPDYRLNTLSDIR